jgi:hypothetical protein
MALGGLVLPMLLKAGYPEGFSLGLVTASGSLGLLFPPSLPVILYAVVAAVPADDLYLAGLLPGLLLVALVSAYGALVGARRSEGRRPFSWRAAISSTWGAKWELSLPIVVIVAFASGRMSIVEAAAAACAYAILIECVVTRDLPWRQLPAVLVKAGALVGAVLILLSIAMGLTSYLVDAQIPDVLVAWVKTHVHSQMAFLLVLNALLSKREAAHYDVHYSFLSAFTHPVSTKSVYEVYGRATEYPPRYDHYASELVLLYLVALGSRELTAFYAGCRREPAVGLRDWEATEEQISAGRASSSHLWLPPDDPPFFDRETDAVNRNRPKPDSAPRPVSAPEVDALPLDQVRYYSNPLQRLRQLHERSRGYPWLLYSSPWPRTDTLRF